MNQKRVPFNPHLVKLQKNLSEANKQRHKYWTKLRSVRSQIMRYINAHNISPDDFNDRIRHLPETAQETLREEFKAGRSVPLKELRKIQGVIDIMWKNSQFKEELHRTMAGRKRTLLGDDLPQELSLEAGSLEKDSRRDVLKREIENQKDKKTFFSAPRCMNCGLPMAEDRRKFCSTVCDEQYRKKRDQKRRREGGPTQREKKMQGYRANLPRSANPKEGPGDRWDGCEHFKACFDFAAGMDLKSFHCEECPNGQNKVTGSA